MWNVNQILTEWEIDWYSHTEQRESWLTVLTDKISRPSFFPLWAWLVLRHTLPVSLFDELCGKMSGFYVPQVCAWRSGRSTAWFLAYTPASTSTCVTSIFILVSIAGMLVKRNRNQVHAPLMANALHTYIGTFVQSDELYSNEKDCFGPTKHGHNRAPRWLCSPKCLWTTCLGPQRQGIQEEIRSRDLRRTGTSATEEPVLHLPGGTEGFGQSNAISSAGKAAERCCCQSVCFQC